MGASAPGASAGVRRQDRTGWGAGAVGLVCAAVPVAVLLGTGGYLRPGTLAGPVAAQVVWALLAALLVARPAPLEATAGREADGRR